MFVNLARTIFFITAYLCCLSIASAQNFTTKGVEFWAAYGAHASMYRPDGTPLPNGGSQKMVFYFESNKATVVTVEIPALGWIKQYEVKAGRTTTSDEMPKIDGADIRLLDEGVSNKGIHITCNDLLTVYTHIFDDKSSATSLLLPVNICGQEYYSMGYKQESRLANGRSFCFVIAVEDNTEIEVTPSVNTLHHPAGVPFVQKLNKGEVLNLFGEVSSRNDTIYRGGDLTGTYVRTLIQPGHDVCKKVLVFSGSTATSISCNNTASGNTSDNLFQQVPCIDNWGKAYIGIPTLNMEENRYRALVLNPAQKVYVNGKLLTNIINNRYYEFRSNEVCTIRSDSIMAVAQYITSAEQCGNPPTGKKAGDPEMIYLSPNGSSLTSTIIHATKRNGIESHFVNVVMKTNDVDSFRLDGQTMPHVFKVYERNANFSIAQIPVQPGRHTLECDSGFSTYAYGYGPLESYGYNGGYSTRQMGANLGVRNPYESITPTTTCTATPFRFYFDVEERLLSLKCTFHNNPNLSPNNDLWFETLQPDSSYHVDSINTTFYRYYLPNLYQYSTVEQLLVQLTGYFPDKKGCIVKKEFIFLIDVIQRPIARFSTQYDSCSISNLQLIDKSVAYGGSQMVRWQWAFSDGGTAADRNPQHLYNNYGEYPTALRAINNIGCFADTTQVIGFYRRPVASFQVTGVACNKQDLLFKSTSTVENDIISESKWNFSDRSLALSPSVIKQFADSGYFEVKLVAKTQHNCTDTTIQHLQIFKTPEITLPKVVYVPSGDTLRLKPTYKGSIQSYAWAPSAYLSSTETPDPIASGIADITYSITATAVGAPCKATAFTNLKVQKKLNIPTAFTPNGDGRNDTWRIFNLENYADCTVEIYNRWGNRVFHSRGYTTPWNGTYNSQPLPADTYIYSIVLHNKQGTSVERGSISLIR